LIFFFHFNNHLCVRQAMKIVIFDLILLSKIQSMLSSASIMPDPLFFCSLMLR